MRLPLVTTFLLLAVACSDGAGSPVGYTLRFEAFAPLPPNEAGSERARVFPFGDRFLAVSSNLSLFEDGAWTPLGPLAKPYGATVVDGTIVALRDGVSTSLDGATFTSVSDVTLEAIAAVGSALLGLEQVDSFSMRLLRSTDLAKTWAPTGLVFTQTQIEIGTLRGAFTGASNEKAWVRITADGDVGDNFRGVTAIWEVTAGGTGRQVGSAALDDRPGVMTPAGDVVVELGAPTRALNEPYTRLTLGFARGFDAQRPVSDYTRINFVSEFEHEAALEPLLQGIDREGRLLVQAHDRIMRSTTPVGPDGDESESVWAGEGCDAWIDRATVDDDPAAVKVTNGTGAPLRLRAIDSQNRWRVVRELAAGATETVNGYGVTEGTLLMAVAPNGDCLGVLGFPNKAPDDLSWTVSTVK